MTNLVPRADPSIPIEYSECHGLGHQWRHRGLIGIDDAGEHRRPFGASTGMIGYRSQCGNCKTQRIKWITRSGEVINRYEYPDGYSRRGEAALTKLQWRQDFAVRLFDTFTPQAAKRGTA